MIWTPGCKAGGLAVGGARMWGLEVGCILGAGVLGIAGMGLRQLCCWSMPPCCLESRIWA